MAMRITAGLVFLAIAVAGCAAEPNDAQPTNAEQNASKPQDLNAYLRDQVAPLVEKKGVPGLAVGVIVGDKTYIVCEGRSSLIGPAIDERTVFEIGSITKSFTGVLLADTIVRGEVKLEQPLADFLLPEVDPPKYKEKPIRLVDLATHTAGLPKLPTNMGLLINPLNPYAGYRVEDLNQFLADYKLPRAPASKYKYSNVGMGLLGHVLAKRAGKTYEELVVERICTPLGMHDTTIVLSDDQNSRLASGKSLVALPAMNWDIPTISGAGALRSTLHDMLIYLRANLDPSTTPLAKSLELSHEPQFTIREASAKHPDKQEIALAWHITTLGGNKIIWHDGMTGGYSSYMAFVPTKKLGILVLANQATPETDKLGNFLLLHLLEDGKLEK